MDLSLHHPSYGYYQQAPLEQIGCQGDFVTSVSVGSLFGQLLAFQFASWLDELGTPSAPASGLCLVEAGAHDGQLALDILSWLRDHRPSLFQAIHYWILEPSPIRQRAQQTRLRDLADRVRWAGAWEDLARTRVRGVIFANELLDAFPVFRLGWDQARRTWFEWRVGFDSGRFHWVRSRGIQSPEVAIALEAPFWRSLPVELSSLLPTDFTVELSPAADAWWSQAAAALEAGKLLTIDYGLEAEELLAPQRPGGTLRGYRRQESVADLLNAPGEQDLTAHVNFTSIREAGERAGLVTAGLRLQGDFLCGIARRLWADSPPAGQWSPKQVRQFQTLTHPGFFGQSFRVLIQARAGSDDPS